METTYAGVLVGGAAAPAVVSGDVAANVPGSRARRLVRLVSRVDRFATRIGEGLAWGGLLLARVTVGVVFVQSGWAKLHSLGTVTEFFASIGIPAPAANAVLASTTELVCGAMLVLGLATRFAAVPLIVTMVVAIRTALWDRFEGLTGLLGLTELAYIALLSVLATHGAGIVSIDRVVEGRLRAERG